MSHELPENNNVENTHNAHEKLLNEQWEKTQNNKVIEALKSGQDLSEILESLSGFKESFHELKNLDCSDGRICSGSKQGLAGVGILLSSEERLILIEAIKNKGLTITGHENCGAAAIAFPGPDSDNHGYDNAKLLAEETGNTYKEIHSDEFLCQIHNERSIVVEGTGRFDSANWKEFPPHFINSAPSLGLPDSYVQKEIVALAGIALAGHGFTKRFDAANPFYIIISASNQEQLQHLTTVSEEAVKEFGDRVQVKGFVAPETQE